MSEPTVTGPVPIDEQPTLVTPAPLAVEPVATGTPEPQPTAVAVSAAAATTELVTCPECGTTAQVTLNRREAADFCRNCDYPLFWTPAIVLHDNAGSSADSLRRLPGTVGRSTVASLSCPHCAELNAVSATVCVRCGGLLHPVEEPPAPPPEPVYVPPPPEPVYVEPERGIPWWVWVIAGVVVAAVIALVVLLVTHTIG